MSYIKGLTLVAEHDFSDGCYQFDIRAVWVDDKGRLFTARDSGCSCPSPFEEYHSVKDLERLTSFKPLQEEYRGASTTDHLHGWDQFAKDVRAALRTLRTK